MLLKILRSTPTLFLVLVVSLTGLPLWSQDAPDQKDKTPDGRKLEQKIEERDRAANGIQVGEPKLYDDSLLQQMLSAAQARLMSLQILDQAGIASRLGSITGASQTISSFGLSLQGLPLSQVATTNNGATNSTLTTGQTATTTSATPSSTTTNTVQNTAGAPVTNVTTTAPSVSVPTVSAPAPSTTLPSSFAVSASDILNEQMQLTYEIANLRLLLEGSLNDRLVIANGLRLVKPRVTVGFPITLTPDKRHKNAVAIVEVEVEKAGKQGEDLDPNKPPALLALLPREKTYNVASITDKSVSIGAGVVTQVASVAGSFLHATKTYYLVQDQDTLALTYQPEDPHRIGFLWQFRPVLGADYVKSGLKQTFVQIAFPSTWSAPAFGAIHLKTYWKGYDRRHSVTKGVLRDSLKEYPTPIPILNLPLDQHPKTFDMTEVEDLGNGQMLVTLKQRFLGGTYVRVGTNILADGSPGFMNRYQQIQFVSPIADLATKQVSIVARDGTESPLLFDKEQFGSKNALRITGHTLTTADDANSRLTVRLDHVPSVGQPPLVFIIGGKVFGYADAPIRRNDNELSVILPTAFLIANPVVSIKALFTDDSYWEKAQLQLSEFTPGALGPKMALLDQGTDSARFLLYGNGVDQAEVVAPAGVKSDAFGNPASPNVRSITLKKEQIKAQKQLALQMKNGLLFLVPVPSVEFADTVKPPIKAIGPVVVGADEVIFQGEGFGDLQKVVFDGIELKLRKQADGKRLWVKGLRAAGVTAEPKMQTLDFYFKSGKTPVTLTVSAPKPS
jgi:hypothetical protein